jgi:integrase
VGVLTGRRISQLLSLELRDVCDRRWKVQRRIWYRRSSVKGKRAGQSVPLPGQAQAHLQAWVDELRELGVARRSPLWRSQGGGSLSYRRYWALLTDVFDDLGMWGRLGCHCMRKTFAELVYTTTHGNILTCREALGHTSVAVTQRYLGFRLEESQDVIAGLSIGHDVEDDE